MSKTARIIGSVIFTLIAIYLIWRFSNIVIYILIATILSLIGRPLVNWFNTIRIGKFRFPKSISAFFALFMQNYKLLMERCQRFCSLQMKRSKNK